MFSLETLVLDLGCRVMYEYFGEYALLREIARYRCRFALFRCYRERVCVLPVCLSRVWFRVGLEIKRRLVWFARTMDCWKFGILCLAPSLWLLWRRK